MILRKIYNRSKILKLFEYKNVKYMVCEQVYEPSDDTFLILDNLTVNENDQVLEIGTGTGIISIFAAKTARKVVSIDISPLAVECAQKNFELNDLLLKSDIRLGDLFEPILPGEQFDVILFNPPYLPTDPQEKDDHLTRSWNGGPSGREITDRFINNFDKFLKKNGRVLLIQSSLTNPDMTINKIEEKKMIIKEIKEQKFFMEKIFLYLIKKVS